MREAGKLCLAVVLLALTGAAASARIASIDSNLNLRAGPGPQHRVIVVMPAGASVTVGNCRGEWCQVDYKGKRGYVSSALLKGGDGAYAAAPPPPPSSLAAPTRYDANDGARVLQWNDPEWRDRYLRDLEYRRRQAQ